MNVKLRNRKKENDWPHYKRLLELCYADSGFMEKFLNKPQETVEEAGLIVDVEMAQEAVAMQIGQQVSGTGLGENYYSNLTKGLTKYVHTAIAERYHEDKIANPKFKAWFLRKKRRILFESFINRRGVKTFFTPISFELTKGCSVGCSFCCLAAGKLTGCFPYSRENAEMWKKILESTKKIIGQAAGSGVCYFATEPLDNPDYEKFIENFHQVFGYYPQTTTARAAEDPKRVKKLLSQLGEEHLKHAAVRFSIIRKEQLEKIHREFTPEELAGVELLLNNPESRYSYSLSGRAVRLKESLPREKFVTNATSICTAGFVVNLAECTIMLIAPRNADEVHPLGMKAYETVSFQDETSYKEVLLQMIEKWMKPGIPLQEKLNTGTYITYRRNGNYLKIQGDKIHRTIGMDEAYYTCFTRMVEEGWTLKEALQAMRLPEFEQQKVMERMQALYDAGYIDRE